MPPTGSELEKAAIYFYELETYSRRPQDSELEKAWAQHVAQSARTAMDEWQIQFNEHMRSKVCTRATGAI